MIHSDFVVVVARNGKVCHGVGFKTDTDGTRELQPRYFCGRGLDSVIQAEAGNGLPICPECARTMVELKDMNDTIGGAA